MLENILFRQYMCYVVQFPELPNALLGQCRAWTSLVCRWLEHQQEKFTMTGAIEPDKLDNVIRICETAAAVGRSLEETMLEPLSFMSFFAIRRYQQTNSIADLDRTITALQEVLDTQGGDHLHDQSHASIFHHGSTPRLYLEVISNRHSCTEFKDGFDQYFFLRPF